MRIGHGYDVHAFTSGDYIVLGGCRIPHNKALLAHSDGDVLLHALCDALLGAAALGDIGEHFSDSDPRWKNIDSRVLLKEVVQLLKKNNWQVANVDATIVAQAPKLLQYKQHMCANIASDLNIALNQVNVKATTSEKLGFIGREQGIAAYAVCLLKTLE